MRNGEVLERPKDAGSVLLTVQRRKANWIGHILRKNCLLKHVIEGKIEEGVEVMGTRRRRSKQLLDEVRKSEGTGN